MKRRSNKPSIIHNALFIVILCLLISCTSNSPNIREVIEPTTTSTSINIRELYCDSPAEALAWEDLNGNGISERNEPLLEGVCVDAGKLEFGIDYSSLEKICNIYKNDVDTRGEYIAYTDKKGFWRGNIILFGGCWPDKESMIEECKDIVIFAIPPEGFRPTTNIRIIGCYAEFGFVRKE